MPIVEQIRLGDVVGVDATESSFKNGIIAPAAVLPDDAPDGATIERVVTIQIALMDAASRRTTSDEVTFSTRRVEYLTKRAGPGEVVVYIGQLVTDTVSSPRRTGSSTPGHPGNAGLYVPYPTDDARQWDDDGNYLRFAVEEPVNQVAKLREWRPAVARAMHGYVSLSETETFKDATAEERRVVRRVCLGLIGHAWWALDFWAGLVDENGLPLPIWTTARNIPKKVMDAICADPCNTETWARRVLRRFNVGAFASAVDAGQITAINAAVKPWAPGAVVVRQSAAAGEVLSSETIAEFHDSLESHAKRALDYYDDHVSHRETPHGHEDEDD